MPITHTDGQTYFSAAEVESTVKDRLKNVSLKHDELDAKVKAMEPKLAEAETWRKKADTAARELAAVRVIGPAAAADPDALWLLEATHERVMASVPEAQRADFTTWLGQVKKDPALAPSVVRHLLSGDAGGAGQGGGGGAGAGTGAGASGQGGGAGTGAGAGAGAGGAGQGGGAGAGGRPAWAPAVTGQAATQAGGAPNGLERIAAATSLDDLVKLQRELGKR